jgi:CubicO group peptidase (beta-lactamase class C family)
MHDRPTRRRLRHWVAIVVAIAGGAGLIGIGVGQAATSFGSPGTASLSSGSLTGPTPGGSSPGITATAPSRGPISNANPSPSSSATNPPSPTLSTTPPGPRADAVAVALQAALDRVRTKLAIPGASVTVLFPDGSSWTGSSGLADVGSSAPVSPHTAFAIASMSKTFTSALILQLVDEGRIHLTDSAASWLPALPIAIDRRITIAMLLDHTSGLADYFLNPKIDGPLQAHPTRVWTASDALRYVGKRLSPPGRAWHYSNTNYLLLGIIAERVTGESLATAIRERLLDPTGLRATWYQGFEAARAELAHGYRLVGTGSTPRPIDLSDGSGVAPFRSVVSAAGGAGSIAATSEDVAQWARALYTGQVLGPAGTALLLSGFSPTTAYLPGASYGYGVQALAIDGRPTLGHSGRLLGFRGVVRHVPLDGITIAVLTNQSRADPGVIVRTLLRIAVPPPPVCPISTCRTAL